MTLMDLKFFEVIENAKSVIKELANKDVTYIVGLYACLYSLNYDEYNAKNNVINSLKLAYKRIDADKIYQEIKEKFLDIEKSIKDAKEKAQLWNECISILKNYSEMIQKEIQNRFEVLLQKEKDKEVLSVACAIIKSIEIKDKKYPRLEVQRDSDHGFIEVRYADEKCFTEIISSVLGRDLKMPDVRILFYKYLLGFQSDSWPKKYALKIYPYAKDKVEELASKASNYVKIPKESEVKSKIIKLYENRDFSKLSAIECALSTNKKFFSDVFGITSEKLREIKVRRIINRGYVNPLVYEHVEKVLNVIKSKALVKLKTLFKDILKKEGYKYRRGDNNEDCIFTKSHAKPIYVHISPWPSFIEIPKNIPDESIKAIIVQGALKGQPLKIPETHIEFVWLFLDKKERKIYVALNTYRKSEHGYFLLILKNYKFSVEPIAPYITKSKDSKDILEDIVARVLQDFGFSVKIARKEEKIELDVQGEKRIKDAEFKIYSSCKNQDKDNPVDSDTVKKEIGRVVQLPYKPHLKMLIASFINDSAKDEASRNGFLVIEIGEKVREDNSPKVYLKLYKTLNELFSRVDS
jgi:hypothetical protein